jgi:hypothetical protein
MGELGEREMRRVPYLFAFFADEWEPEIGTNYPLISAADDPTHFIFLF